MQDDTSTPTAARAAPVMKTSGVVPAKGAYLRKCWYQAAWSYELATGMLARTICDLPILLFQHEGRAAALLDRCPHRFAPLSAGKLEQGVLQCGYHGLAFDGSGRCVRNPHGALTSTMRVSAFPVVERHRAVWLWLGEPGEADESLIPDLSFIDRIQEDLLILMHMPTSANYQLMTDNIMDLSHADYLHPTTLGGVVTGSKSRQFDRGSGLVAEWINLGCDAPGVWQPKVTSPAKADYYLEVTWRAPAVMTIANTVVPAGQKPEPEDCSETLHNMTPETQASTHYFVCSTRPPEIPEELLKKFYEQAFLGEDKPMLEAQQRRIGKADFWQLQPILLKIDAAAVKVRRRLDDMIATESAALADQAE